MTICLASMSFISKRSLEREKKAALEADKNIDTTGPEISLIGGLWALDLDLGTPGLSPPAGHSLVFGAGEEGVQCF